MPAVRVGDIGLRGWTGLQDALQRLVRSRPVHAVLVTGAPFYPMLMAAAIRRRFALPVVLDFQDPWVSHWGAAQPYLSKAGIAHQLATRLEPRALKSASFVTSVSEMQNQQMAARYPWLDARRMAAIPIGGDPDDFATVRRGVAAPGRPILAPDLVNISYVGTLLPRAFATVRLILKALARFKAHHPAQAAGLRLNFVGTTANTNDTAGYQVMPMAQAEGVADAVHEVPERIPYLEALTVTAGSDAALLIGSDEPHYTASKIYPALMSGRPYLSLFHRASSSHAILAAAGGGFAHSFGDEVEREDLVSQLSGSLRALMVERDRIEPAARAVYAPFEASAIAKHFADIFDRVAARP